VSKKKIKEGICAICTVCDAIDAVKAGGDPREIAGGLLAAEQADGGCEPQARCPVCSGIGYLMGTLGRKCHYRCRGCGIEFSHNIAEQKDDKPKFPNKEDLLLEQGEEEADFPSYRRAVKSHAKEWGPELAKFNWKKEAQLWDIGHRLAKLFGLKYVKRGKGQVGGYQTAYGLKSARGLYDSVQRIMKGGIIL
jgi:hypothetical protein